MITRKKPRRIRGRHSMVLSGETKGGQIVIRLDTELHRRLAQRAADMHISLNAFALHSLEKSLASQDQEHE